MIKPMTRDTLDRITLDKNRLYLVELETRSKSFRGEDVVRVMDYNTLGEAKYRQMVFIKNLKHSFMLFDLINMTSTTYRKMDLMFGSDNQKPRLYAGSKLMEVDDLEQFVEDLKETDNPLNIIKLEVGSSNDGLNFVIVDYEEPQPRYIVESGNVTTGNRRRKVVGVLSDEELEHFSKKYRVESIRVD